MNLDLLIGKIGGTILLVTLMVLVCAIFIMFIIGIWNKSWYQLSADVSISTDEGRSYAKNYPFHYYGDRVYLQYEITARATGFLSKFFDHRIPFCIETSENGMNIKLHEYSGICFPELKKASQLPTEFFMYTKGKKTGTAKIVFRCERNRDTPEDRELKFILDFPNRQSSRYSRKTTLEYQE